MSDSRSVEMVFGVNWLSRVGDEWIKELSALSEGELEAVRPGKDGRAVFVRPFGEGEIGGGIGGNTLVVERKEDE